MDYEKLYKKSLERASKLRFQNPFDTVSQMVEYIFPELKKSEDEKIRKAILNYFTKCWGNCKDDICGIHVEDILAWLEKQGKKSPFNKERLMEVAKPEKEEEKDKPLDAAENLAKAVANAHPSFDFKVEVPDEDECPKWFEKPGEKPQGKTALEAIMEEKSPAESLGISPEKYEEIVNECIYGESVDKVVPKFKIGDWVVFIASENVYQVEKIENYEYTLRHTLGGSMPLPFSSEELIRPWTIKDVKPGDVLVGKIDGDNYILIFKQIKDGWIETYGHYYDAVNRFCIPSQLFCRDYKGTFYPATKEHRDTLIKAITDAGYTFDFEKKELKKIEDEPENFKQQLASEMADLIIDYVKQKPADIKQNLSNSKKVEKDEESKWTEEDEQYLLVCKNALHKYQWSDKWDADIISKWLEDKLKQRIGEHEKQDVQNLASSAKTCKNDTLYDLLKKIPSCITLDGIDYHFVMKKTIFYKAYYEGEGEEGKGKVIFMVTDYSPIDLLTEMLEILKEKGLLE